jgi:branched-chain amino acid transport system substrate-binding protein
MLRKRSIDAVIAVEGKRVDAVAQIADPALHLLPINYDETLQANYLPAQLTSDDYPNLIAKGEQVDTIAATSVLAVYNWSPGTDRYRRLALLVDALFPRSSSFSIPRSMLSGRR